MTSGGHHSYAVAKDADSAVVLDKADKELVLVRSLTLCHMWKEI
jgi:hypothetical protein